MLTCNKSIKKRKYSQAKKRSKMPLKNKKKTNIKARTRKLNSNNYFTYQSCKSSCCKGSKSQAVPYLSERKKKFDKPNARVTKCYDKLKDEMDVIKTDEILEELECKLYSLVLQQFDKFKEALEAELGVKTEVRYDPIVNCTDESCDMLDVGDKCCSSNADLHEIIDKHHLENDKNGPSYTGDPCTSNNFRFMKNMDSNHFDYDDNHHMIQCNFGNSKGRNNNDSFKDESLNGIDCRTPNDSLYSLLPASKRLEAIGRLITGKRHFPGNGDNMNLNKKRRNPGNTTKNIRKKYLPKYTKKRKPNCCKQQNNNNIHWDDDDDEDEEFSSSSSIDEDEIINDMNSEEESSSSTEATDDDGSSIKDNSDELLQEGSPSNTEATDDDGSRIIENGEDLHSNTADTEDNLDRNTTDIKKDQNTSNKSKRKSRSTKLTPKNNSRKNAKADQKNKSNTSRQRSRNSSARNNKRTKRESSSRLSKGRNTPKRNYSLRKTQKSSVKANSLKRRRSTSKLSVKSNRSLKNNDKSNGKKLFGHINKSFSSKRNKTHSKRPKTNASILEKYPEYDFVETTSKRENLMDTDSTPSEIPNENQIHDSKAPEPVEPNINDVELDNTAGNSMNEEQQNPLENAMVSNESNEDSSDIPMISNFFDKNDPDSTITGVEIPNDPYDIPMIQTKSNVENENNATKLTKTYNVTQKQLKKMCPACKTKLSKMKRNYAVEEPIDAVELEINESNDSKSKKANKCEDDFCKQDSDNASVSSLEKNLNKLSNESNINFQPIKDMFASYSDMKGIVKDVKRIKAIKNDIVRKGSSIMDKITKNTGMGKKSKKSSKKEPTVDKRNQNNKSNSDNVLHVVKHNDLSKFCKNCKNVITDKSANASNNTIDDRKKTGNKRKYPSLNYDSSMFGSPKTKKR